MKLVHAYSLGHDDLPSMDNAQWRRGKPCCHRAFSDATTIFVGDALILLAFEILMSDPDWEVTPSSAQIFVYNWHEP